MWDILTFRKMVTPGLLKLLFWLAVALFIIVGIVDILQHEPLLALGYLVLAPLILRVVVELMMCLFAINNQLNDLRHLLSQADKSKATETLS